MSAEHRLLCPCSSAASALLSQAQSHHHFPVPRVAVGADAEAASSPGGDGGWMTVRAAVCATADARAACQLAHASLAAPGVAPSRELVEAPIWTTWARYFSGVTQAKVLKYAHEVVARGLQVTFAPAPCALPPAPWSSSLSSPWLPAALG